MENTDNNKYIPGMDRLINAFPWFVFSLAVMLLIVVSFVNMDIAIAANIKNYSIYVAVNALSNWSIYFAFKQRSYLLGVSEEGGAYNKNFNNYLEDKGKIKSFQSFCDYTSYRNEQLKRQYIKDTVLHAGANNDAELAELDCKDKKRFPKKDQRNRIYNVQHNVFPECGWSYNDIMYLGQDSNAGKTKGLLAYQDVDLNKRKRIMGRAYGKKGFYTVVGAMFAGSVAGTIALSGDGWVGMLIKIFISILLMILAINAGNLLGKKLVSIDKDTLGSASITIGQYEEWDEEQELIKRQAALAKPENAKLTDETEEKDDSGRTEEAGAT